MIQKLIVTNVAALKRKYGTSGVTLIRKAIARLVASDAARGIKTTLEAVDAPRKGAPPVTSSGNAKQNKTTIDRLFVAYKSPDYLLILGGPDVIPFQPLDNPMFSPPDDTDPNVPSDLPYASSAPYSRDISKFIGATRVVGRIPDVRGSKEVEELVLLIDAATTFSGTPNKNSFVISADEWASASRANVRLAFGATPPRTTEMVPPNTPAWSATQLAAPIHFINCHGGDRDPNYFGSSPTFPNAHEPANIVGKIRRGSVVTAECCYGAQLYDPTAARPLGLANTYLLQGAIAYCGSTNIAYGGALAADRCAADILCVEFVKLVLAKASLGRALLQARLNFVSSISGPMDPSDLKTLGQFVLLGDPSNRPFGAGLDAIKSKGVSESVATAAIDRVLPKTGAGKMLMPAEHRARRQKLLIEGQKISSTKTFAARKKVSSKSKALSKGDDVAKAVALLADEGLTVGQTLTFRVERPAGLVSKAKSPKAKSAAKAAAADVSTGEEIHVTFSHGAHHSAAGGSADTTGAGLERTQRNVVNIKAVVTRIRDGQVLSSKKISSK